MQNVHIALTVNREHTEVAFAPYKTLLEVLREDLNLCGTKHGCELGECGACAVLLDEAPHPTRDRIREALSGNLCRCTGYQQIFEAVEAAIGRP